MKKAFARALGVLAILASGAASMGCIWILFDEPSATELNLD